jgi:2'-hydroxyisoflavone reductase
MKVLVLGGTRFVGRHILERLARDGHQVICFHRGQTNALMPLGVEERLGDRNESLSPVAGGRWDAIVDTSCYRTEQMQRSLELRTDRYFFISTVSVYRDFANSGISEDAATIEEFDPADEAASYGGNKAACERVLLQRGPTQSTILRPALIAGAWDNTGRFTYWCRRLLRGGDVLAPGDPNRPVQFIDAADIADFVERALSKGLSGVFNLVGPARPTTMVRLLSACEEVARDRGAPAARIVWIDDSFLLERGVQPWMEMPLWLPDPRYAGMLEISNAKALTAGLQLRPIAETVKSVLDNTPETLPDNVGLLPQREAELVNEYRRAARHSA